MKKVLFATTALVATAGMAAADVRISGYGRFGLDYNEANGLVAGRSETNLTSRLRLQFDMSAETDGGVTFGARFRAQANQANAAAGGAVFNGARFFATAGGLTLGVGNIIGALEGMPGLYLETRSAGTGIDGMGFHSIVANVGPNANYFNWDAYSSGGAGPANGIEVIYSAGAFGAHVSYTSPAGVVSADRLALNLSYTFGDWTAALGVQESDNVGEDKIVLTVQGDLGIAGVRLAYAQNQDQAPGVDADKLGLYGVFDIGAATTLVAWVTNEDNPANLATDGTSYGLNVSHDLGGGVTLEGGFVEHADNNTQFQAGAYFSF